jgi:hypothetical protein
MSVVSDNVGVAHGRLLVVLNITIDVFVSLEDYTCFRFFLRQACGYTTLPLWLRRVVHNVAAIDRIAILTERAVCTCLNDI